MYVHICPLLKAGGYQNGFEMCDGDSCAWYVQTDDHEGCALAILAVEQNQHNINPNKIEN